MLESPRDLTRLKHFLNFALLNDKTITFSATLNLSRTMLGTIPLLQVLPDWRRGPLDKTIIWMMNNSHVTVPSKALAGEYF